MQALRCFSCPTCRVRVRWEETAYVEARSPTKAALPGLECATNGELKDACSLDSDEDDIIVRGSYGTKVRFL